MEAQIRWNSNKNKYQLVANGKVLVTSKNVNYLEYLVGKQQHSGILHEKVTSCVIVSREPTAPLTVSNEDSSVVAAATFSISERFEFMEELIGMVINKSARAMLISGEGGVGKTHSVLSALSAHGKVDVNTLMPTIHDAIDVPDSEDEMQEKITINMNAAKGDYVVVKGRASPAALYRILYENRDRIIIFDDCDSVLRDDNSVMLLKGALDSYEDRWISWRVERIMESDLPQSFKFSGSVIFISNMPMHKVDEAILTRVYKVDLSMTKAQRIERMRNVLPELLPEIEFEYREDALNFLDYHKTLTNSINFRTLMDLIMIRQDSNVKDWKKLCLFVLTEH